MTLYTYTVTFDVDDNYEIVHNLFRYTSVKINYWKAFTPPNYVDYILGPLTQKGIDNWREKLMKTTIPFKEYVEEIHDILTY